MASKSKNFSDPIANIGRQINTTVNQVQEKFQDMSETVGSSLPDIMSMTQKALYSSCYYLAFGSVYVIMFTAKHLMGSDPVGSGLREGAAAAKESVHSKDKNVPGKPRLSAPKVKIASPKRKATPPRAAKRRVNKPKVAMPKVTKPKVMKPKEEAPST
jgi:hypothetical protein